MLSTIATAALINFLILQLHIMNRNLPTPKTKLKIMMLLQYPNREAFSTVSLIKL